MWIHILILLIYCALFLHTKGWFCKFPQYYNLTGKQVRVFLLIAFLGNLMGLAITLTLGNGKALYKLEREEDVYYEDMYVTDGEQKEKLTVEIDVEPYTEEEKQKLLDETLASIPKMILGENKSLDQVEYPLNLVTEIPESGIILQWSTDQPLVLDWEGTIGENVPKEGTKVSLRADLLLDDSARVYESEVIVFPQKKTESEMFLQDIETQLEEQNKKQGSYLILPKESEGKALTWSRANQSQGLLVTGFAALVGILLVLAENSKKKEAQEKRRTQMQEDYPAILNKFILLMQAGMSSRRAIQKMALDYRKDITGGKSVRYAYEEILQMYRSLEQGIPEETVYRELGNRCELICYRSLSTLLIQNLKKGSSSFLEALKKECTQAFEERKNRALVKGEEAGTKLLIPMVCMLLIVLLIILVPSMMTLG